LTRKAESKPISLRAYAKRRGVSAEAVSKAIESGRLERSVVVVAGEPKIADAELADREWAANTRPRVERAAPPADGEDAEQAQVADHAIGYPEARRRREIELWRQARVQREVDELELAKRKGELVSVAEARADVIEKFSVVKTRLLGLAVRVKQRLPHVVVEDVRVIDALVREALEALALGGG
jgi:phage terminase Nu1 subunit (DNA packaging protein)